MPPPYRRKGIQIIRLKYVAANGRSMRNRGEKAVRVVKEEGNRCLLNMQVAHVKKPAISVAGVCGAGHIVISRADGGTSAHGRTDQETRFHRVDGIDRIRVSMCVCVPKTVLSPGRVARVSGKDWASRQSFGTRGRIRF